MYQHTQNYLRYINVSLFYTSARVAASQLNHQIISFLKHSLT